MGVYNNYVDAVLANGSTKGVYTTGSNWGGHPDHIGKFRIDEPPVLGNKAWVECAPAYYLESLAAFYARGLKLVKRDKYTSRNGDVVNVKTYNLTSANAPILGDEKRFVVKAAAYDTETPEEKEAFDRLAREQDTETKKIYRVSHKHPFLIPGKIKSIEEAFDTTPQQYEALSSSEKPNRPEWQNGDDVVVNGKHLKFACLDPFDKVLAICCSDDELEAPLYYHVNSLSKPETPEEREERERLEAAYDLYCTVEYADGDQPYDFDFWSTLECAVRGYLAIVDKTGYRKHVTNSNQ